MPSATSRSSSQPSLSQAVSRIHRVLALLIFALLSCGFGAVRGVGAEAAGASGAKEGNQAKGVTGGPAGRRPNILLLMSDDLREAGGGLPPGLARVPNLDRLAARGVRFERAYAQYPVCNPSRVSLLTGWRCEQTGIVGNDAFLRARLPDVKTFPEWLRQHGWSARSYGKILHAGNTSEALRDEWLDKGRSWDHAEILPAASPHRRGEFRNLSGGRLPWCEVGILDGPEEEQPDARTAAGAVRAIEEGHASGRPWLVAAGFHRPHDPFHSPRKYYDLYPREQLRLYRDPADQTRAPALALTGNWVEVFGSFSDEDRLSFLQAYLAGMSFMDAQVGRILDTLDRLRLWDNTVVIFMGDHGYHLGERGWWNKNTLFERSCRAPLVIAAPGAKAGAVCRSPVEYVDVYPTVIDYAGLKPPHALAGRSLRDALEQPDRARESFAFTLVTRGPNRFGRSVTDGRWRFTRWSDGAEELYDHQSDPEETRNRAGDAAPELSAVRARLAARLASLPPWPAPDARRGR